jgi:PAS domain S-box-containing protein
MSLSYEELKAIIVSSPNFIWKTNTDKTVSYFNKAWLDFRGRSLDQELVNGWEDGIHPEDLERVIKEFYSNFDKRQSYELDFRLKRHDDVYRLIREKAFPYYDNQQNFTGYLGYCYDITDQNNIQEELNKERKRLSGIIQGTNSGTWEWHIQTGEVTTNARWAEILGYSLEELEPISIDTWIRLCHPEDLKKSNKLFESLFSRKIDYYECEVRMQHKNGDWVWILDRGKVTTWDDAGKAMVAMGTHQDITDRKKDEESLKKERERLSGILEGTNSGTWEWNVQTGETIINNRWAEMLGYKIEELKPIGQQTWFDLCHPEDREKSDRAFELHCQKKTNHYECEFRMKHKNGGWIWILDRGKIVSWTEAGEPLIAMGTHQDITERKEAETQLANSETKYRELVENTTDVIYTINTDGEFTYVSNAWKRQLGHDREEVIGKSFKKFLHPDEFEPSIGKLREAYYSGKTIDAFEYRIRHKDGSWRWHSSSGSFKKDATGAVKLFDGLSHDITQRKQDEAKIAKQNASQKLLLELASSFINVPLKDVDKAINSALAYTGEHFGVDRSYIFDYDWEKRICINTYEWCAEGITPEIENLKDVPLEYLPQWVSTHIKGEKMVVPNVQELDKDDTMRHILDPQGIKSLITLPLMKDQDCIGFVGFDSVKNYHTYSKSEEDLLILFSEMLVNITKRRIADEEMLKQKEKAEQNALELEEAQKVASLATWHYNLYSNQVTWSKELYKMYGFDPSGPAPAFTEQENLYTADSWKKLTDAVDNAKKYGTPYELELNFIKADKTKGWLWAKGEAVYNDDGKIIGLRGVAQDTTNRKQLELELNKSKEQHESAAKRLRVASTSAGLGIFEWEILEDKLIWDDRMYELYDVDKENTELTFDVWSNRIHPDDLEKALEDLNTALNGNEDFNSLFRIINPDGKEYYIKAYGDVIRDDKGLAVKLIGVNMDVTESQIHQRSLEFKNKQLVDFSNILAHNLRAPLVNIGMLVDFIEESEDPEETAEFTTQLKNVLDHLNEVFNELMESIQIRQDLDIKSDKIDLNERIHKILKSLNSQIVNYGAKVDIDITAVSKMKFPSKYIDSILSNLISNALKYKSPKRNPVISIKTERVNRDIILSVKDNGLGIDMKIAEKNLFKIRKVFHNHTDAKGFGLFLIKTQIDAMKGEIWVESEPDKGSTFFVKFKNAVI